MNSMKNNNLPYFITTVVVIVMLWAAYFFTARHKQNTAVPQNADIASLAKQKYEEAKAKGVDMQNGPCLGIIKDDWVLDIAHNPRLPVDNEAQNQCPDYLSGKAHHFIEMDPEGNVIKSN